MTGVLQCTFNGRQRYCSVIQTIYKQDTFMRTKNFKHCRIKIIET
jgi:hypothetical protein